jgi:hypothetical protein
MPSQAGRRSGQETRVRELLLSELPCADVDVRLRRLIDPFHETLDVRQANDQTSAGRYSCE